MIKEIPKQAVDDAYEGYLEAMKLRNDKDASISEERLLQMKVLLSILVQDAESVGELFVASNALAAVTQHYIMKDQTTQLLNQMFKGETDGEKSGSDEEDKEAEQTTGYVVPEKG